MTRVSRDGCKVIIQMFSSKGSRGLDAHRLLLNHLIICVLKVTKTKWSEYDEYNFCVNKYIKL